MSNAIANTSQGASAAVATATTTSKDKQRSPTTQYLFDSMLAAEKSSQQAAAADPGGAAGMTSIDVRVDDRVFHIAGRMIDMSTVKATPLAELAQDRYDSTLAFMERLRDTMPLKPENLAPRPPSGAPRPSGNESSPAENFAALQADPEYRGIVSQIEALKAARAAYLEQQVV